MGDISGHSMELTDWRRGRGGGDKGRAHVWVRAQKVTPVMEETRGPGSGRNEGQRRVLTGRCPGTSRKRLSEHTVVTG